MSPSARRRRRPRPVASRDARRLYGDLAWTWPIVSPPEHYVEESEVFAHLIRESSRTKPKTLLHLGCGGGHNDFTLKSHFDVTGVDVSPAMLRLARGLNPEVDYRLGDMRSVRLRRVFDAVAILDSINYMLTEADLRAAFATAFLHLRPGGVLLTHVEDEPRRFVQNQTKCLVGAGGGVEVAFVENDYDPDPTDTTFESTFVFLIRRNGRLEVETDRHLCGIFPMRTWTSVLRATGFRVVRRGTLPASGPGEDAIPILVCRKPA